jgi:hypothetical protein
VRHRVRKSLQLLDSALQLTRALRALLVTDEALHVKT